MKPKAFMKISVVLLLALAMLAALALYLQPAEKALAATPSVAAVNSQAGSGGVTTGHFVKLSADGVIVLASAATDKIVGVCEETALINVKTRYAPIGTVTTVVSGGVIAGGDCLTSDASGHAVAVNTASASNNRFGAVALTADSAGTGSVTAIVCSGYVNTFPTYTRGSNAVAADALAIPVTKQFVSKTTGADAESLTLADGTPGQILTITLIADGGGDGTLTPTTKTGFATIVFADKGDTVTLLYVDDTVGWVIIGSQGVAAPPVITVT